MQGQILEGDMPHLKVTDEERKRLLEYMRITGESKDEIGFAGPSEIQNNDPDAVLFRLICAHDLLEGDPTNGFRYLHLARAFLVKSDIEAALSVLLALAKKEYKFLGYYDDPHFNIGLIEADRGNFGPALGALDLCASRFPDSKRKIDFYKATVLHEERQFSQAVQLYETCLADDGDLGVDERKHVAKLLADARHCVAFSGKRSSAWLEFIH